MTKLEGVFPPIITIFNEDGDIDYEANKIMVDNLIEKGVDGVVYLGTSGEFTSLTMEEKKEFLEIMIEYVNNRVQIIVGAGNENYKETIELVKFSEELKVDAVLIVNTYFNVFSEKMVVNYFQNVAKNTDLPVLLYNIPGLSGYNFTYSAVEELVTTTDNILGIKESLPNFDHVKEMLEIKNIKPDFKVYCAYEDQALLGLKKGIDGFINATANFAPEFTVNTYRAFNKNDEKALIKNYENMVNAMDIYKLSNPLYLACKQASYERFLNGKFGERTPAVKLDSNTVNEIKNKLISLNLIGG